MSTATLERVVLRPAWLPTDKVPAVAATRVVRGLARHGFTLADIAAMTGVSLHTLSGLQTGRTTFIPRRYASAIAAAGDRVKLDVLPSGRGAHQTRASARKKGWVPLAAWDCETLGDPNAQPNLGMPDDDIVDEVAVERALSGERLALNEPERALAVRLGLARGMAPATVAAVLGMNFSTARSYAEHGMSPVVRKRRRAAEQS